MTQLRATSELRLLREGDGREVVDLNNCWAGKGNARLLSCVAEIEDLIGEDTEGIRLGLCRAGCNMLTCDILRAVLRSLAENDVC